MRNGAIHVVGKVEWRDNKGGFDEAGKDKGEDGVYRIGLCWEWSFGNIGRVASTKKRDNDEPGD